MIKRNCKFCDNLEHESGEDGYGWYSYCGKSHPKAYLKSFPFEKEQDCHEPGFLQYVEGDPELVELFAGIDIEDVWHKLSENKAYQRFLEKYGSDE